MKLELRFDKGYIADPYWPERYRMIEIQKVSGMMRARSEQKRRQALEQHLKSMGMTYDDYVVLGKLADRPFHMNGDGSIIIPAGSVAAMIVNGTDLAPSKMRLSTVESIRTVLRPSDFRTDKRAPDGVWERFAVVQSGSGGRLSNQRGLRASSYIADFLARGEIQFDAERVKPEPLLQFLAYCGSEVGIGASRKMGWGRFTVEAAS